MLIAIVGEPLSGKSTVFDAITGISGLHRKGERHGVVMVPDSRLDYMHEHIYPTAKKVGVHIEFIDTVKMDFSREEIRNADGYLLVANGFTKEPDPEVEIKRLKEEMILKDLEIVEKRLLKLSKAFDADSKKEKSVLERLKDLLENGRPVTDLGSIPSFLKGFNFSSGKPLLCAVNVSEERELISDTTIEGVPVIFLKGKLEREISELSEVEREEFYRSMEIDEPVSMKVIRLLYKEMGLITFYSISRKEVHAWSIEKGKTVKEAAGVIHSDLERGFIRAEVISFEDLKRAGDEKKAKEMGLYRVEGKEYIVRDGDIVFIRFSV